MEKGCFAPGDVFWINPAGVQRTIRTLTSAQVFHLYLEPEFVASFAHDWIDPERLEILPAFRPQDPLIQQLGLVLKSAVLNPSVVDALYADAAATMLAAHLLRYYSNTSFVLPEIRGGQSKLQVAIEYIHAHLDEELCIDTLARLVQMSPYHFIRLFKHSIGLTPHCYIVHQRLERAKQLLKTTNLPIAEIAYLTGFCHQSRFSTVFRQYVHTSPKAYREQQ
ncbi:helix-turn-helix domain-containing protein [Leptolyngbya sp. AN03gr2]|uniref:helix-turn-helix domain-containing protein n=1 Tax=unclassified Leptolyngbya TaxID=2650499 RepID=UPI003D318A19